MIKLLQATRRFKEVGLVLAIFLAGCERPPIESQQQGFRGTAMAEIINPRIVADKLAAINIPDSIPPIADSGTSASAVYQNVQVLGDLDVAQFTRLMAAITAWVAPEEGCAYCHEGADFASDGLYTKVVSRRMIEMTQHINADWTNHVGATGVTCYTCHKGENVPAEVWAKNPGPRRAGGMTAGSAGQNTVARQAGDSSLPYEPFSQFFLGDKDARVISTKALPDDTPLPGTKQTEETYAAMMHMSDALGVNCTYCHNSRAFADWESSSPARVTAWYGLRMARGINNEFLEPLVTALPENRLGPLGDAPKANCATCHGGLNKPLNGAAMLQDHPELVGVN